jgi:hypothetical protein
VEFIRDEVIQEIFGLAFFTHRDREVAIEVVVDTLVRIPLVRDIQDERPKAKIMQPYKLRIPEDLLPRFCLYLASDLWERDQEKAEPKKRPVYRPNDADYLTRYIKFLVWQTMDRHSRYVAVALGCLLHNYGPTQISELSPAFFDGNNIRNTKKWLADRIRARFNGMNIVNPDNAQIISRLPIDGERILVQQALEMFSDNNHIQPQTFILDTVFADGSSHTERERIHAVACPVCGGMPKLIREWNDLFETTSRCRLADPETKLRVPIFTDAPTDPTDRLYPHPLSDVELSRIRLKLYKELFRRKSARPSRLRLCVDGEEYLEWQLDALSPGKSCTIPSTATYIEIFGDDSQGDVLLAIFPLSGSDITEDEASHWSVTTECGLKIELMISAVDGGESEQIKASIQVGIVRVALSLSDVLVNLWLMPRHNIDDLNIYERSFYEWLLNRMFSCTEVHGLKDESAERHLYEHPITDIQIAILSYIDELIDGLSDSSNHVDSPRIEVLTFPGRPPPKVEGHWPRATIDAEFGEREWSVPDLVLPGEGAGNNNPGRASSALTGLPQPWSHER